MSEPQSNIEIEDVLSSIRRLVSQDHRRAPAAPPLSGAVTAEQGAGADLVAQMPEDPQTLILSAALRVGDDVQAEVSAPRRQVEPVLERGQVALQSDEAATQPPERSPADEVVANVGTMPEQEAGPSALMSPDVETRQWEPPVGDIFKDNFSPPSDVTPQTPHAFEEFAVEDGVAIPRKPQDLGEELSRLEGSIAEMEAAFAEPSPAFEPELGDPFGEAALPESFESDEWQDAEEVPFVGAEEYVVEASEVPEADYLEAGTMPFAAGVPDGPSGPLAGGEASDEDLGHEVWTDEPGALGFSPEDDAERAREAARAQQTVHRLHVADAHHHAPAHEPLRSTYEELRAEADMEPEEMLNRDVFAPDLEGLLDGMDAEALRDLVRDMIRQELQGALGERITRNVRKLVRREIQRSLTVENFDQN